MSKLFVQVERVEDLNDRVDDYFTQPKQKQKPITNADRIRAMSDEKLAKYLAWLQDDEAEYPLILYGNEEKIADELEWLKQEVSE